MRTITRLLGDLLLCTGTGGAKFGGQPSRLIKVSASRARVLCPSCQGENDESFHFCQMCGVSSDIVRPPHTRLNVPINEEAIQKRCLQFQTAISARASTKSRVASAGLFSNFLASRDVGAQTMEAAQPKDALDFLCWMDSCSKGRRTPVHSRSCSAVGKSDFKTCSTKPGECTFRYAHDSLRSNYVSKLTVVYEKELGTTTVWNEALGNGNPFKSELVSQYMAFTREEQKKAGVLVKQAPALLQSHLSKITALLQAQLRRSTDPLIRVTLARDIAVFHGSISVRQKGETNLLVRS